jgi:glycosyltransferase involved in cell wall biosynthesis
MNNPKVAFLLPSFFPNPMGGSELQALILAEHLKITGYEISILTPKSRENKENQNLYKNIPVYRFTLLQDLIKIKRRRRNPVKASSTFKIVFDYENFTGIQQQYSKLNFSLPFFIYQLNYFISILFYFYRIRREVDIIYVPTITWIGVIATMLGKFYRKTVVLKDSTMNGLEVMHLCPFRNRARKLIIQNCYFVAMTDVIYQSYIKYGVGISRIYQIPNGIDIEKRIKPKDNFDYKCLFVGNLTQQPAKGIDVLLKAWIKVVQSVPNATLHIVGDGPVNLYADYTKTLDISNSVFFYGKQEVTKFYQEADVFVLPSRREGMSNALMEAMLYGKAIVATRISGNIDLIEKANCGVLVPVNDSYELARAIVELLSDINQAWVLGRKAQDNIKLNYGIVEISNKYDMMFNSINIRKDYD